MTFLKYLTTIQCDMIHYSKKNRNTHTLENKKPNEIGIMISGTVPAGV